jgi:hypothetical protein
MLRLLAGHLQRFVGARVLTVDVRPSSSPHRRSAGHPGPFLGLAVVDSSRAIVPDFTSARIGPA